MTCYRFHVTPGTLAETRAAVMGKLRRRGAPFRYAGAQGDTFALLLEPGEVLLALRVVDDVVGVQRGEPFADLAAEDAAVAALEQQAEAEKQAKIAAELAAQEAAGSAAQKVHQQAIQEAADFQAHFAAQVRHGVRVSLLTGAGMTLAEAEGWAHALAERAAAVDEGGPDAFGDLSAAGVAYPSIPVDAEDMVPSPSELAMFIKAGLAVGGGPVVDLPVESPVSDADMA